VLVLMWCLIILIKLGTYLHADFGYMHLRVCLVVTMQ